MPTARISAMEQVNARSIFSPATGFIRRGGFDFSCNPYLGCSFGCNYCYAMFTPQNRRPRALWGKWFQAKSNAVALLAATSGTPAMVFAASPGQSFDMNALIKEALGRLGGRGGGSKDMAQGGPEKTDALQNILSSIMEKIR